MTEEMEQDAFSTHQVPLISAVLQTTGPVVEFGMGNYSSPILHELCHGRILISVDNSDDWKEPFGYLETKIHKMVKVEGDDWAPAEEFIPELISVCLIDNGGDVSNRVKDILRYRARTTFFVVHDSNVEAYGFEEVFKTFRYRYEYKPHVLHTMVLSDTKPFELRHHIGPKVR